MRFWDEGAKWFGVSPWVVIGGGVGLLLLLLLVPFFSVTKVVEVTETVMTTVTRVEPETVTEEETFRVYTGWMKSQSEGSPGAYYSYSPPVPSGSGFVIVQGPPVGTGGGGTPQLPAGFHGMMEQSTQQSSGSMIYFPSLPYSYYSSAPVNVTKTTIDPSDLIVEVEKTKERNNTWTVTLIDYNGKRQEHKNVTDYDLTKTVEQKVPVTKTRMNQIQEQVPKTVTNEQVVQLRVNLIQLVFRAY